MQRNELEHPGDVIHMEAKRLARFRKVGHPFTGNRQEGHADSVGYVRLHVAIEMPPD
jgi:hypothetical protein